MRFLWLVRLRLPTSYYYGYTICGHAFTRACKAQTIGGFALDVYLPFANAQGLGDAGFHPGRVGRQAWLLSDYSRVYVLNSPAGFT